MRLSERTWRSVDVLHRKVIRLGNGSTNRRLADVHVRLPGALRGALVLGEGQQLRIHRLNQLRMPCRGRAD